MAVEPGPSPENATDPPVTVKAWHSGAGKYTSLGELCFVGKTTLQIN